MRYRIKTGFAAWLLMRASGLVLTIYLALHVWVLSHLTQGPEAFDQLMRTLEDPLLRPLEIALAAVITFHAANGVRLILVDLAEGARYQRPLFWLAAAATVAAAAVLALYSGL